jgi:hypothetical protein
MVDSYKACAQSCDALYSDVVDLARAGLLGPITHEKPIPADWFMDPRVKDIWQKYFKSLQPLDLPVEFRNDSKWKAILNTA